MSSTALRSPAPRPPAERPPGASGGGTAARSRPLLDAVAVVVPGLLALALNLAGLTGRSLWLDEGATVAIASQHGAALWHAIAHDGGNMLAYYLLEHVIIGALGPGVAAIRIVSVLAGGASAALVGAIALRLFAAHARRHAIALGAGALTAVSLPLVFWGQDARGYALMVALGCASFLAFISILQAPVGERAPVGWLAVYVLATLGAIYVGFDAALIVAAQLGELALTAGRRRRARTIAGCLLLVGAGCVPLVVLALQRGSGQLFWVPGLGGPVLGQAGSTLLSAGLSPNFPYTVTSTATAALSGLLVLGSGGLALSGPDRAARLPALWLLVPLVLGLIAAVAGEPIELARAAVLLIPAVGLLLAWGLAHPRLPPAAGVAAIAALLALRGLQLAPSYGTSPEDWSAAAAYVTAHSPGGACVAFYPEDGRMPFDLYVRGSAGAARLRPVLPVAPWSEIRPYVERYAVPGPAGVQAIARRCGTLWLLASHQGQRHATAASLVNLRRYDALAGALRRRYPHHSAHRFGYAAVVRVTRFWRR